MTRWAVVLAGGVGSRFWPLSTSERPKQLLALATEKPLLEDAVDRLRPLVDAAHTFILTSAALTRPVSAVVPDVPSDNIIAEPRPAGTAAALTWAALTIQKRDGPGAMMICVHADWAIRDPEKFRQTLLEAEEAAERTHSLITVGIVPTRPDTGFGYIQSADPDAESAMPVRQFVEKPDRKRAQELYDQGFLWNSGIFVWRVGDFLAEVKTHTPELRDALAVAADGDPAHFFGSVKKPVAVDVGVLERSRKVMVIPGAFGWDDIGTWSALKRVRDPDEFGNVTSGDVHMLDCQDNVVHAESGTVVMYGVENLVVVTQDDITLVTTTDRAADLKRLLDSLPQGLKPVS